jgi:DNA-directed RNA polymerase specialized sigma24 family protein
VSAGDNTKDERWRPGFASSERRVREELADAAEAARHVFSRELSFVPAQTTPRFEPHDPQTQAMIAEHKRLEELRHGPSVLGRLDEWKWMEAMSGPQEKQAYLEPLIRDVRHDPVAHEDILLFLLIVFEPIRRGVSNRFIQARGGTSRHTISIDWRDRTQARAIREIERQTLYDVTREAIVEAIFRYPTPPPERLFPWFRTVASRHALIELKKDLSDARTPMSPVEAEALQLALVGLDHAEPPVMRDTVGLRHWRRRLALRDIYETVETFYRGSAVRSACKAAIGRLPAGQAAVINGRFFEDRTPHELALARKVSRSTIYNHTAQALRNMEQDDCFFSVLVQLGILRDATRRAEIAARYPDGRLPDGRRIVVIGEAA